MAGIVEMVTVAVGVAKGAKELRDLLRGIREKAKQIRNEEARQLALDFVAEAMDKTDEVKDQLDELKDTVRDASEKIRELERQLEFNGKIARSLNVVWVLGDRLPCCGRCLDTEGRRVTLRREAKGGGKMKLSCEACKMAVQLEGADYDALSGAAAESKTVDELAETAARVESQRNAEKMSQPPRESGLRAFSRQSDPDRYPQRR